MSNLGKIFGDIASTKSPASIPFITFEGWLKCHRPEFSNEFGAAAFAAAFPKFLARTDMTKGEKQRAVEMTEKYGDQLIGIIWSGRPPRRFAGDAAGDTSLPRGRYYSVCSSEKGEDNQTLANELMAYRDPQNSGECYALDLSAPEFARDGFTRRAVSIVFRSKPPVHNPFLYEFARLSGDKTFIDLLGKDVEVQVPYRVERQRIENVVDLRLPTVRDWFFDKFFEGDGEVFKKILVSYKKSEGSFLQMLPSLVYPDLGGNDITHAIGTWLRLNRVNALVYPSARCDVKCVVQNGKVLEEHCWGWNLVDYRGAPEPKAKQFIYVGDWDQEGPMDSISSEPNGSELYGSFLVDGVLARREKNFANAINQFYSQPPKDLAFKEGMHISQAAFRLHDKGDLKGTRGLLEQAIPLCRFSDNKVGEQNNLIALASVLNELGESLDLAAESCKAAEELCRKSGDVQKLIDALNIHSYSLCKLNRPQEALPLAEEGYQLAKERNSPTLANLTRTLEYARKAAPGNLPVQPAKPASTQPRTSSDTYCKYCGRKFDPQSPGQCSFHPAEHVYKGHSGVGADRIDISIFPCCNKTVKWSMAEDPAPPRSPGCTIGKHEA